MQFDVLTIFPAMFESYFSESIIKRAIERGLLEVRVHDLRDWADNKHNRVDDKPYGGGPGMVMQVGPFYRALKALKALAPASRLGTVPARGLSPRQKKTRIILMSAKGKRFTHQDSVRLAKYSRIVLLCGRYEGVDERVAEHLAYEEISIGDFVLTGGELPAMTIIDSVSRQVEGVLGKSESLDRESHSEEGLTEHPQYTRPEIFEPKKGESWTVPEVLTGGDHAKIEAWRKKQQNRAE